MNSKKRPSGRDCALAQATLALIDMREKEARENTPIPVISRDRRLTGVRLIDLERRARFVQRAS
jgi:hypothetical protein